jgi:acetoin utilization deacetylase AcuC-like enzyme
VTFGECYCTPKQAPQYLEHLERVTKTFSAFDLILYQAGADLHVDHPLGGVLDSTQLRHRDRIVFEAAQCAGVPLAWDLAGGYQEPIEKVIAIHLATMQECVCVYAS